MLFKRLLCLLLNCRASHWYSVLTKSSWSMVLMFDLLYQRIHHTKKTLTEIVLLISRKSGFQVIQSPSLSDFIQTMSHQDHFGHVHLLAHAQNLTYHLMYILRQVDVHSVKGFSKHLFLAIRNCFSPKNTKLCMVRKAGHLKKLFCGGILQ